MTLIFPYQVCERRAGLGLCVYMCWLCGGEEVGGGGGGETQKTHPLFAQCTSVFLKTDLDFNMPLGWSSVFRKCLPSCGYWDSEASPSVCIVMVWYAVYNLMWWYNICVYIQMHPLPLPHR